MLSVSTHDAAGETDRDTQANAVEGLLGGVRIEAEPGGVGVEAEQIDLETGLPVAEHLRDGMLSPPTIDSALPGVVEGDDLTDQRSGVVEHGFPRAIR